jgi:uncharacterized protein (DUF1330 family)
MKTRYAAILGMAIGLGLGAVAVEGLHAQAKPPVYYIGEIDVSDADAYAKEYLPGRQAIIKAAGGRYLASGKATPIEGDPPKSRVILLAWDSMEALQAWRDSDAFKAGRKIGGKYASFRSFAIPGTPQ